MSDIWDQFRESPAPKSRLLSKQALLNKQTIAMLLFSGANAAINPYKNIFGVEVIGLPEFYYSLVILVSGLMIAFLSIYFGIRSDQKGSFVKYIVICSAAGFLGNILVFAWPNPWTYFLATCVALPVFCALNSLIFGYAAANRRAGKKDDSPYENAALRSSYSMGYVLILGLIGIVSLKKSELIFIWLFSGIMAGLIFVLYFNEKFSGENLKSAQATESIFQVFDKKNIFKLLSVSFITSMLFTLDATAPFVIINQAKGGYSNIGTFEAGIAVCEILFIFIWSNVAIKIKEPKTIILGGIIFLFAILLLTGVRNIMHVYLLIPLLALGAACLISIPIGFLQSLAENRPGIGGSLLAVSFLISSSVSSAIYFIGNYFSGVATTICISAGVGLAGLIMFFYLNKTYPGGCAG